MKKKLSILFAFTTAITISYNIHKSQSSVDFSELALVNIEALASDEESKNYYHLFPCPSSSGNECKFKDDPNRPECPSATYCN